MIHEDEIKKLFGAQLREMRTAKGYSQESLANTCELDRTYIGGVERGERNISLVNIVRISQALGVSPRELMPSYKKEGIK